MKNTRTTLIEQGIRVGHDVAKDEIVIRIPLSTWRKGEITEISKRGNAFQGLAIDLAECIPTLPALHISGSITARPSVYKPGVGFKAPAKEQAPVTTAKQAPATKQAPAKTDDLVLTALSAILTRLEVLEGKK